MRITYGELHSALQDALTHLGFEAWRTLALREKHLREGIPVDRDAWEFVQNLHRNAGVHRPPSRHGAA